MFDAASLSELEEKLGYEHYVLKRCVSFNAHLVNTLDPAPGSLHFTLNDAPPHAMTLSDICGLSDRDVSAVTQELSPLLFTAGYKLLDMVLEWIIHENTGESAVWQFEKKRKMLADEPFTYPGFLNAHPLLRERFLGFYECLADYRNAIIHGHWGQNKGGRLEFDFVTRKGVKRTRAISFQEVMQFGKVLCGMSDALLQSDALNDRAAKVMLGRMNELAALHGKGVVRVTIPSLFQVTRRTSQAFPALINMKEIRHYMGTHYAAGRQFEIDLRVQLKSGQGERVWQIPAQDLPGDDFILDETWGRFEERRRE